MQDLRAAEAVFEEEINAQTAKLADFGEVDLVIGIPFYNEDALGLAIQELQAGLAAYCPEASVVITCVGSPAGEQALARLNSFKSVVEDPRVCAFLLQDRQLYGKGWGVKALLKIAAYLHSDLVILEADFPVLLQGQSSSRWIELLADPVRKYRYDLVLGCFERHPFADALATDLISPVLAATYGWSIPDPHGDELALSNSLVNRLLAKQLLWSSDAYQYGIGIWLLTTALAEELRVCCANLGSKMTREYSGKRENMAHQILRTLLQQVQLHYPKWSKQGAILRSPGTLGLPDTKEQVTKQPGLIVALSKFRRGFDASTAELFKQVLAPEVYAKLNFLAEAPPAEAEFSDQLWLEVVFSFLLASAFRTEFAADDLVQGLLCLLHGRRAYQEPTQQVRFFHYWRGTLVEEWQQLAESSQPVLPQVAFWEFIPGVPMTLPQEVTSSSGKVVSLIPIYEALIREYRQRFATFVQDRLGLEDVTVSAPIVQGVTEFMTSLEARTKEHLLPSNFTQVEGAEENVQLLFDLFQPEPVFALKEEVVLRLLHANPPAHLLTKYGSASVMQLTEELTPRQALALANCTEGREYLLSLWDWIRKNVGPEDFTDTPLEPLVVDHTLFYGPSELRLVSKLSRLSGIIVVTNLEKQAGGKFRSLRYLTVIGKNIIEVQAFSRIWRHFGRGKRQDFAAKIANSLEGHWGRALFSAHNIFENGIHRQLTATLRETLIKLREGSQDPEYRRFCEDLILAMEIYPLAVTLEDGQFIPLSTWTWASYSYKGGKGVPGPLSLHVERDWFSREIWERCCRVLDEPWTIDELIIDLMGQGAESTDLAELILPAPYDLQELFTPTAVQPTYPPVGELQRFPGNPILEPLPEHDWEAAYVLNNAAIRLDGRIYLLYRAFGRDSISRVGLAVTEDGFQITERLAEPIFGPGTPAESAGCEDPRLVQIEDRLYMTYTAYDGVVPQIAIASISVEDFLGRRWERWQRHGLAFPNFPNKDAVIFPERINGKYAMLHRVAPSIWLTYADTLDCPWPKTGHKIIMGPRYGMLWDAIKIGAGAQPLKTRYGWLLIYHGVDYALRYSLGVMLVDLVDPGKLLYRSPNPILVPATEYEQGVRGQVWVPNVVFTCGAVPTRDTDILEDNDQILVYYGAADTYVGVATATVEELLPIKELELQRRGD